LGSRKGKFGTSTAPFGAGAPLTDLSVYQIGSAPAPVYRPQVAPNWYTAAQPPVKPTVAPAIGVMPQPVIPTVVSPYVTLRLEQEAIAARAVTTGHTPTASDILNTQLKNQSATLAAELEAIRQRAIAAGKTPTEAGILATYQRNLAGR